MNEEPEAEVEVQPEETEVTENTEQPQVEQEESGNIFDALFSAAEAEPEPEPEPEPVEETKNTWDEEEEFSDFSF